MSHFIILKPFRLVDTFVVHLKNYGTCRLDKVRKWLNIFPVTGIEFVYLEND
jgi:hypothetical protein